MKYLILNGNAAKAQEISERIWSLTMPDTTGNVTKSYTSHITHPVTGKVALMIHGEATSQDVDGETVWSFSDSMRVHPDADTDAMAAVMEDAVTPSEKSSIKAKLATSKGGGASLLAFCMQTPSLSNKLKTKEQLEADGWFPPVDLGG